MTYKIWVKGRMAPIEVEAETHDYNTENLILYRDQDAEIFIGSFDANEFQGFTVSQ